VLFFKAVVVRNSVVDPHHLDVDPDADPGYQNDADSCGSGSTTLVRNTTVIVTKLC
jgi:hypothetical protein